MEPYLYHGIKWWDYDLMIKIIESGYILPRCMIKEGIINDRNNLFNGTKYISLTEKQLIDGGRSSYEERIFGNPCFVLKRDNIELIRPHIIELDFLTAEESKKMLFQDGDDRYSYYEDELQTKDKISLKSNLVAVGLPEYDLDGSSTNKAETVERIRRALNEKEIDVPIINSSMYDFADSEEDIKRNVLIMRKS